MLRGLPLAVLLVLPAVRAARAADPDRQAAERREYLRLQELRRELEPLLRELRPMVDRIPELQRVYDEAPDAKTLKARRYAFYGPMTPLMDRVKLLAPEYARLRQRHFLLAMAAVSDGYAAQGGPSETAGRAPGMREIEAFNARLARFVREADDACTRDEQRSVEAVRRVESRDRLRWWVGGIVAAAALACGLLAWLRLRPRRPEGPAAPAFRPPKAGDVIDDLYHLERELGRGATGIVHEAVDLALGRKAVVNSVHPELLSTPDDVDALLSQTRALAALTHPNIVRIYTALQDEHGLHLVFEFVEGQTLAEHLAESGRLPLGHVKSVVRQTAAALEHAHAQKVLHLGLTPGNILVQADGTVKVAGFGMPAGQPSPYSAPEQDAGHTARSADLYALGACAYEMLAGRPPFPGPDFAAQKLAAPPADGLPPAAYVVLRLALDPEPRRRFRSAAELDEAFEAL